MKRAVFGLFLFVLVFSSCSEEKSECKTCTTVTTIDDKVQSSLTIVQELCDAELEYNDGLVDYNGPMIITTTCE